uniref:Uncharacterized protein n=1 Tax=viral metagenome TaxID=1070528 RepID=A0A6M3LVN1_9ZZZZ
MKPHYFEQTKADEDDFMLEMAKQQGYVPKSCLLGGMVVMALTREGKSPCSGCNCDRKKCEGRPA